MGFVLPPFIASFLFLLPTIKQQRRWRLSAAVVAPNRGGRISRAITTNNVNCMRVRREALKLIRDSHSSSTEFIWHANVPIYIHTYSYVSLNVKIYICNIGSYMDVCCVTSFKNDILICVVDTGLFCFTSSGCVIVIVLKLFSF